MRGVRGEEVGETQLGEMPREGVFLHLGHFGTFRDITQGAVGVGVGRLNF